MKVAFFVTGTGTNVGKTWVTITLMRKFRQMGFNVAGMKPVASGCIWQAGRLRNHDALLIQENAYPALHYEEVNPFAFELPVSPNLARGDTVVELEAIQSAFEVLQSHAEAVLVEGAGGWYSPLGRELDNAGLAEALQLPVLIAVGMQLGCINHAKLTLQAVRRANVHCAGWLAVEIAPSMLGFAENLQFLKDSLDAPFLGVLPYMPEADFDVLAQHVSLEILL